MINNSHEIFKAQELCGVEFFKDYHSRNLSSMHPATTYNKIRTTVTIITKFKLSSK
jgi:hypothetical protein